MRKNIFFLFLSFCISVYIAGQPKCFFEHFGPENGLPQHTVMNILQDKKGFMWFSTWDGLCKFDGYQFSVYKIQGGDLYHMRSNRIDLITEDRFGNIWALPYDREPHRFDPRTETFKGLRSLKEYAGMSFSATQIVPTKTGSVWLLSDKMGCVEVIDSTFTNVALYNTDNKKLRSNKVNQVFEDSHHNSWLLTDDGLYMKPMADKPLKEYFTSKSSPAINKQKFYSALEDNGKLWFGGNDGKIWIYNTNNKQFEQIDTESKSDIIQLHTVNENNILIVTDNSGFIVYNKPGKTWKVYNMSNLPTMKTNKIINSYVDKSQNIWFDMDCAGISKFNLQTGDLKNFVVKVESSLSNVFPPNFFIFEDCENRLWIHPRGGGFSIYDPVYDRLLPFYNEPFSPNWRFSNMLHTAFSDKQGNLWISTRSNGLEKVIFNSDLLQAEMLDSNMHSSVNNNTRGLYEDSEGKLWVTTKGEKTFVFDASRKQIGYLCVDGSIGNGKPIEGVVYAILEDSKKNIWLGTKGEGLYKLIPTPRANKYDVIHYSSDPQDIYSLSNNNIYSIYQDKNDRIWIGTYGGGINLLEHPSAGRFINPRNDLKKYPIQTGSQVRVVSGDKNGNIYVGTTLGLIVFTSRFTTPNQIGYKMYNRTPSDQSSLGSNDVYDICTTTGGDTYIATFGGGVNKVEHTDKKGFPIGFKSYTTTNGLPSNVCLSIVEDVVNKKLWISTEGNLTKFDPATDVFETYSEVSRLIKGYNFSEGAKCHSASGKLYFGYSNGYIVVNPNKIKDKSYRPYIALTNFRLFNKDVEIAEDSPLNVAIDDMSKVVLKHDQNFFSIEFAALDMVEPKNILYSYKLEGFDKDWIDNQKQRVANYTNLSPGKYIFKVRSTNSDGQWVDNERVLPIIVKPAFWQTGWAYALYVIGSLIIILVAFKIVLMFYRLKDKMALEHEQTEMKTRFFTDISHEIRTPLTLIVAPLENILEGKDVPDPIRRQLDTVLKNSQRMLKMVNQILDFRKIQKQTMNVQEVELGIFVGELCRNFNKIAEHQNIDFSYVNEINLDTIWGDKEAIEKVVFNLLSNAFKYTPKGGRVEMSVYRKDKQICLQVKDNGEGIPKEIQNKLFLRFQSFSKDKNKPSTGIGLSIVKEIIDKHYARIVMDSEVGKGSTFTIFFMSGKEHFGNDVHITPNKTITAIVNETVLYKPQENRIPTDKYTILVVEDDSELRAFIVSILSPYYTTIEAANGKEGYEMAKTQLPDFIISDIMMPEMDGIELLQQIRANDTTSHIPLILLTAKANIESKLSGLEYGADDYITKPFNVNYFRARIENIINQRKRIYEKYISGKELGNNSADEKQSNTATDHETSSLPIIGSRDAEFLKRVRDEVEKNIDDTEYTIDHLVASLSLSRTVFFKKVKSLTGYSPIDFIRDIKMKHAAHLLQSQQYTVKEVSFMVGIIDTKYFTQIFKKAYGMTPSEYKATKASNQLDR